MRQVRELIKPAPVAFADVHAEEAAFTRIVDDVVRNAGDLLPISNWITLDTETPTTTDSVPFLAETFSAESFQQKFSTLDKMLHGWIGRGQMIPVTERAAADYAHFVGGCDVLNLWAPNVTNAAVRSTLIVADLGSIMDLNLLSATLRSSAVPTAILEVGGGYGRLAEAALSVFGDSIRYVVIDVVPGSLYYAKAYIERSCPDIRVGSYYDSDPFDLDRFHCYVIPPWHFQDLNTLTYDICINIESFQEMAQKHVDYYLEMFQGVSREDGVIYVSNAHDYLFAGEWKYPSSWRKILCANTPRSWTRDHPTEIFVKTDSDWSAENAVVNAAYRYGLEVSASLETILRKTGARTAARPIARYYARRVGEKASKALRKRVELTPMRRKRDPE